MTSRSPSPDNDIFAIGVVPERENKAAGTISTDFDGRLTEPLSLHEDLKDGCGGQLWPAGITLARYMLDYHHDLRDKKIIELGAGGGLVGLAMARGCLLNADTKIVLTDQVQMLPLMQKNITLSSIGSQVSAEIYNWGEDIPQSISSIFSITKSSAYPDIVLAADCVYFEPAFPLLLRTLIDLIGPATVCYFCFKKRRKADLRFIRDMNKAFDVRPVQYADREEDRRQTVFLYEMTKKS